MDNNKELREELKKEVEEKLREELKEKFAEEVSEEFNVKLKEELREEQKEELKEKNAQTLDANTKAIQEIMEQAITNPDFKKRLLESPDEVLDEYNIGGITRIMIKSLSEEDYDKLTPENITEYFAAESAIYTPDIDDSQIIEYYDEDDL